MSFCVETKKFASSRLPPIATIPKVSEEKKCSNQSRLIANFNSPLNRELLRLITFELAGKMADAYAYANCVV